MNTICLQDRTIKITPNLKQLVQQRKLIIDAHAHAPWDGQECDLNWQIRCAVTDLAGLDTDHDFDFQDLCWAIEDMIACEQETAE